MDSGKGNDCADCTTELDHCHGTLLHHTDGTRECTDRACVELDPARHAMAADCGSVAGGCICVEWPVAVGTLELEPVTAPIPIAS